MKDLIPEVLHGIFQTLSLNQYIGLNPDIKSVCRPQVYPNLDYIMDLNVRDMFASLCHPQH